MSIRNLVKMWLSVFEILGGNDKGQMISGGTQFFTVEEKKSLSVVKWKELTGE